jgi:hypothetical protein
MAQLAVNDIWAIHNTNWSTTYIIRITEISDLLYVEYYYGNIHGFTNFDDEGITYSIAMNEWTMKTLLDWSLVVMKGAYYGEA